MNARAEAEGNISAPVPQELLKPPPTAVDGRCDDRPIGISTEFGIAAQFLKGAGSRDHVAIGVPNGR